MTNWCDVLLVLLSQLALWVNNLWGWLLENAGGAFSAWWERQERAIKILILAGVTLLLGAVAWLLGAYVFACSGWPTLAVAAFMIVSAIAGLFIGGKRYEAGKADRYEAENLELRAELTALYGELEQLRRSER